MAKKIISTIIKIVLILVLVMGLVIFIIYVIFELIDNNKMLKVTSTFIGNDNLEYITKLDDEVIGFTDFRVTYIYQVDDLKKISCDTLNFDMKTNFNSISFDNLAAKYLNDKNNYCIKQYETNNRGFNIGVLQDNILMIRVYQD